MGLKDLGEGDLRAARAVLHLPLASAGNIAAVQRRTDSGVHTRLRGLSAEDPGDEELGDERLVESVALGCYPPPG